MIKDDPTKRISLLKTIRIKREAPTTWQRLCSLSIRALAKVGLVLSSQQNDDASALQQLWSLFLHCGDDCAQYVRTRIGEYLASGYSLQVSKWPTDRDNDVALFLEFNHEVSRVVPIILSLSLSDDEATLRIWRVLNLQA